MKKIIPSIFVILFFLNNIAFGELTSGGINWIDPLGYEKPEFVSIVVPDEASCPNKYYINLNAASNGSGTSSSPFNSFGSLSGNPGMSGGPAYVYVRGTGAFQRYISSGVGNFWGSSGNEIVIKPWSGYTATLTYNYINSTSSQFQYIIWDGGSDMGLIFYAGTDSYNGAWNFENDSSDDDIQYWTFYRCQWRCGSDSGQLYKAYGRTNHIYFINNEFYDCNTGPNDVGHQFYLSGADSGTAYPGDTSFASGCIDYLIKNNIYRDNNNGIEINMRNGTGAYEIDGLVIEGNALHNIGKGLCGTSWACRPGITLSNTSYGSPGWRNVSVTNNLIWDTASGCVWARAGTTEEMKYYNNTCYGYGVGQGDGGPNPQGFSGYSNGGIGMIRNNIIISETGVNPFDGSSFSTNNNLCMTGELCGSSAQTDSASNTFLSTTENNSEFMRIKGTSKAVNNGYATGVTIYYFGTETRSGTLDIGSDEYGLDTTIQPTLRGGIIGRIQ